MQDQAKAAPVRPLSGLWRRRLRTAALMSLVVLGVLKADELFNELEARSAPPAATTWLTYDFRVPREELSSQDTDPFLFLGSVMDRDHAQWNRYGPAIRRRPDTLSCLRPEERDAERPNLLAYDWHRVQQHEVCLFRIATTLGSVERVRAWMAASGMQLRPLFHQSGSLPTRTVVSGDWTFAEASERSSIPGPVGYVLFSLSQRLMRETYPDHDERVIFRVNFDETGRVIGAFVSGTAFKK